MSISFDVKHRLYTSMDLGCDRSRASPGAASYLQWVLTHITIDPRFLIEQVPHHRDIDAYQRQHHRVRL